jgi:hypothetical protein
MTSIWLRPEGRQEQQLQKLIDRVAEQHGTVAFAPHLTVCGVPAALGVLNAAAAYVKGCGLLPLMIVGLVMDQDGRPLCCELWPGNTAPARRIRTHALRRASWHIHTITPFPA